VRASGFDGLCTCTCDPWFAILSSHDRSQRFYRKRTNWLHVYRESCHRRHPCCVFFVTKRLLIASFLHVSILGTESSVNPRWGTMSRDALHALSVQECSRVHAALRPTRVWIISQIAAGADHRVCESLCTCHLNFKADSTAAVCAPCPEQSYLTNERCVDSVYKAILARACAEPQR
jgi:hypothetical protein